jgi:hypothetical protein
VKLLVAEGRRRHEARHPQQRNQAQRAARNAPGRDPEQLQHPGHEQHEAAEQPKHAREVRDVRLVVERRCGCLVPPQLDPQAGHEQQQRHDRQRAHQEGDGDQPLRLGIAGHEQPAPYERR